MLDGRMTASQQIEGLQVGDVLDVAWTQTSHDPVLKGRSKDPEGPSYGGVTERYRSRISWPNTEPVVWRVSDGLSQPVVTKHGERTELVLDVANYRPMNPPVGAPSRFFWVGRLDASSFRSWEDASALISPLFAKAATLDPGSPLKAEAAAIAARSTDPKVRAFEALQLVEEKTRYFYLGMNDGGYIPAAADQTWRRRFGDCKGKTVLLLALLHEMGIEAEPALVSTRGGDGLDQALPSLTRFDHVIVRASIAGKVYWLDGTREGDIGGLDSQLPPPWHWVLPLRNGGAGLERIVQSPLQTPMMDIVVRMDATKGVDTPAGMEIRLKLHGDAAVTLRRTIAVASKDDLIRTTKQSFSSGMSWFEPKTVTWRDDPQANDFELDVAGVADMDWRENADVHAREFRFPSNSAMTAPFPRRDGGSEQDAPFALPFPLFVRVSLDVDLPDDGKGFSVRGPNVDKMVAGLEIKDTTALSGNVARFTGSVRTLAPEASVAEAASARKLLRDIGDDPELIRLALNPAAGAEATH